ncbi:MAG: TraR/DksA family transcriptional regulator [Desulfobacterales bacterium]
MTEAELERVRQSLLVRKKSLWSDIMQELERDAGERHRAVVDTIRESGDQALEELFESNVLHMVERKARELENIEAALTRIDRGKYGQCVDCGQWIRPARLEVMPDSIRCRRCQEQYEKIENL